MRRKLFALLICTLVTPAGAAAQVRQYPDDAKRGSIVHLQDVAVEIDGRPMRLSASAQARGQIHRSWVLTPEEAAAPDKKPD